MNRWVQGQLGSGISGLFLSHMINKHALRQALKQRRRALSADDITQASRLACSRLLRHPRFQAAKHIALYSPFAGEIDPLSLFNENQTFYLPVVEANYAMRFIAVERTSDLVKNRYGILEPTGNSAIDVNDLDVIVIPLLGFNRQGDRLGMGAGYYDRALAQCNGRTFHVGFAYSWQEVEQLSSEHWDVPLHAVVTEKEFIDC